MPLYEFKCFDCKRETYLNLPVDGRNDRQECEECKGELVRLVTKPGVHFKGSGWTPKFGQR